MPDRLSARRRETPVALAPQSVESSRGATSFLRLITPGSSIVESAASDVEAPRHGRRVPGHEHVRALAEHVGDHQRVELEVTSVPLAPQRLQ